MLTSKMIKEAAFEAGADLCGIGPLSRFKGAPDVMNPSFLFPGAKSCIALAFRIPRGVQRGIEEGTQFYQYPWCFQQAPHKLARRKRTVKQL
jgi:hypothetical protein